MKNNIFIEYIYMDRISHALMQVSDNFPAIYIIVSLAGACNFLGDLFNPKLIEFINKYKIIKYLILFLVSLTTIRGYLNKEDNLVIHILWSLFILIIFYIVNRLHHYIVLSIIFMCIVFYLIQIYNKYGFI